VQPIAYGAALGLHPLAVLIVTIAGGCLFGTIGLVLAAPLVSAAVRITADLSTHRASAEAEGGPPAQAQPAS
jgi:predicted PurR-regulated permease PerM